MVARGTSIEALMEMWSKDSKINKDNLSAESLRTPDLHSKYLNLLTYHNIVVKSLQSEYMVLKKLKTEYYAGQHNTDKAFLTEYKLEPVRNMILKDQIPLYLESDKDLIPLILKKSVHEEIVEYCKSVLVMIKGRDWTIRNTIEWEKFISGS